MSSGLLGATEPHHCGVHEDDPPRLRDRDTVGRQLDESTVPLLALAQRFLGPLALGGVADRHEHVLGPSPRSARKDSAVTTSLSMRSLARDSSVTRRARQRLPDAYVGRVQDLGDLQVDGLGRRFAVLTRNRTADSKEALSGLLERRQPEPLAHAVLGHHVSSQIRRSLQIVRRAGRDIAEDDLLGDTAAQQDVDTVEELGTRQEVAILGRLLLGVAERGDTPRDDRDLVHAIGVRPQLRHDRVPRFVVRDDLLLARIDEPRPALEPGHDAVDRLVEVGHLDGVLVRRARQRARPR
jgi:hypothetical protein